MLRIGICDDNREDIARIRELAVRFSEEHPETPVQIQAYGQPYDLLDEVEKAGGFDLYLLDVVRASRNKRGGREFVELSVGEPDYLLKYISAKPAPYRRAHS